VADESDDPEDGWQDELRRAVAEAGEPIDVGACVEARNVWPTVEADAARFVGVVVARGREHPGDIRQSLAALRLGDLYLATACASGDTGGILAFEAAFFDEIERAFSTRSHSAAVLDDVRQNVRERLFVGSSERGPEIATYGGRGSLRRWFRFVVVHHTLNWKRREARAPVPSDLDFEAALLAPADPELLHLRQRYLTEFRAAMMDAASRLSDSDRLMLRHHYVERLSIDRIGAIYAIHRVTAARQINKARDRYVELVRSVLTGRLHLEEGDLVSIMRLLPTEVSMSLRRVLGPA
jgi:RNA polymerase sigma-70 factor, ECF subfamily